jgi:hypothetical protein
MSEHNTQSNTGGGCVMNALLLAILAVLVFSVFGGALMAEAGTRSQAPNFPSIPAPEPETLNYQPSVQTFVEPATSDCPDPSLPYSGWEDGVGGVLPPCWTREQQNAYMRSH